MTRQNKLPPAEEIVFMERARIYQKSKYPIELKPEQRQAVKAVLKGGDVLAVLPTGYGKSLIFQLFAAAAAIKRRQHQTVLVVCPLQSIIDDQVAEARSIGMSAASFADVSDEELRLAKFQHLFGSAEKIIEKRTMPLDCI